MKNKHSIILKILIAIALFVYTESAVASLKDNEPKYARVIKQFKGINDLDLTTDTFLVYFKRFDDGRSIIGIKENTYKRFWLLDSSNYTAVYEYDKNVAIKYIQHADSLYYTLNYEKTKHLASLYLIDLLGEMIDLRLAKIDSIENELEHTVKFSNTSNLPNYIHSFDVLITTDKKSRKIKKFEDIVYFSNGDTQITIERYEYLMLQNELLDLIEKTRKLAKSYTPKVLKKDHSKPTITHALLSILKNELDTSLHKLIWFSHSGCKPCIDAIPDLNKLHQDIRIKVIALNPFDDDDKIKRIGEKKNAEFNTYKLAYSNFRECNVQSFPTYFILSPNNNVIFHGAGYTVNEAQPEWFIDFIKSKLIE